MTRVIAGCTLTFFLAACQPGGEVAVPGDSKDHAGYAGIAADETIRFTGTEPFWGGTAQGERLGYNTPETPDGTTITVKRFAGRGGLALSGNLGDSRFDLTITEGECSDGMSDRSYPFTATLVVGGENRQGCAWTDAKRFKGPANP